MTRYQAAARSLAWVCLESGGVSLLSFLTVLVLARLLGPTEFGTAAIALGIVQILFLVPETFFHDAVVQRKEVGPDVLDSALTASVLAGAVLAGLCWLLGPAAERLFSAPGLAAVLGWSGLSLLAGGLGGIPMAVLRRRLEFRHLALRSLSGRVVGAAVGLAMAFGGYGVWALVGQQLAGSAVAALAIWAVPPWRPRLRLSPAALRGLVPFAVPAFTAALLAHANLRGLVLLTGYVLGPDGAGVLAVALRLVDTARQIMGAALQQLALPLFSRCRDDRAALARGFAGATEMTALVAVPLFAGLAALAPAMVAVALGPHWEAAVPLVRVLALAAILLLAQQHAGTVLTAVGAPHRLALLNAAGLALLAALLLAFGAAGPLAATLAWLARTAATVPAGAWMLRRQAGIGWADQVRPLAGPAAAAAVMAAVLVQLPPDPDPLAALLVQVPLGAVLYAASLAVLDRGALVRLARFLGAMAARPQDASSPRAGRQAPAPAAPGPACLPSYPP
ncbi:MAG TPA: lipopolysaccharide biosynthesis protein [Azospirillaceae bacterium]|nr:lipopolysaccharide biosynthesis protein [Azospirillaceae bacterium]